MRATKGSASKDMTVAGKRGGGIGRKRKIGTECIAYNMRKIVVC